MSSWRFTAIEWHQTARGPVATVSAEYSYSDLQQLIGLDVEIDGMRHKVLGVEAFMSNPPKGPYGLLVDRYAALAQELDFMAAEGRKLLDSAFSPLSMANADGRLLLRVQACEEGAAALREKHGRSEAAGTEPFSDPAQNQRPESRPATSERLGSDAHE